MASCCEDKSCELAAMRANHGRVLWIVLVVNAAMFFVEGAAGLLAHSTSLLADALDMLGDALVYGFSLFVLARSAFHHSVNYRSVMAFGTAHKLTDEAEIVEALRDFTERLYPGRWDALRPIQAQEIKATTVLAMDLTEAVAKVRTGMPIDDDEDYALPIWAGVLPVQTRVLAPLDDPKNLPGLSAPDYLAKVSIT